MTSLFRVDQHTDAVELPDPTISAKAMSLRYWYGATIPEFLGSQTDAVVGRLAVNCDFALVDVELCVYATATLLFLLVERPFLQLRKRLAPRK